MPRKITSMIEGVVMLRQQKHADDDNQEAHYLNDVGQDTDVDSKPIAIDIKSHASAVTDFMDASVAKATKTNTITTSGREQRTLRSKIGRVRSSESADHTSQRDGSTEGVCLECKHNLPPHRRCSRDQDKPSRQQDNTAPTARVGALMAHHPG